LVRGPYVHHATAVHGNILPIIFEALNYLPGIRADFFNKEQESAVRKLLYY